MYLYWACFIHIYRDTRGRKVRADVTYFRKLQVPAEIAPAHSRVSITLKQYTGYYFVYERCLPCQYNQSLVNIFHVNGIKRRPICETDRTNRAWTNHIHTGAVKFKYFLIFLLPVLASIFLIHFYAKSQPILPAWDRKWIKFDSHVLK